MASVAQTLDQCEDSILSDAARRCDKVKLEGKLRGQCTRAQFEALESLKENVLSDKDAFEKGPASVTWINILVRAQIKGKSILPTSAVDAAVYALDRCLVSKFPSGQKYESSTINELGKNADIGKSAYSVAIRSTRQGVSFIEVTRPNGSTDLPIRCKDGTLSFLEPVPRYVEDEVQRLFRLMAQEGKAIIIGSCVRGGIPDFGRR